LLVKREQEIAGLVAEGLMNRDIAQKLGLSEHTISNYLFRIYEKLGISSRVELVLHMVRNQRLGPLYFECGVASFATLEAALAP
jgi:DNA-binding NarL/FixJ family response regulator